MKMEKESTDEIDAHEEKIHLTGDSLKDLAPRKGQSVQEDEVEEELI